MPAATISRGTTQISLPNQDLYVGGAWQEAADSSRFDVVDPATEEVIASVASGGEEDVDRAVGAARAQLESGEWSRFDGPARRDLLFAIADLIERDADVFAQLEALEVAKPVGDPRGLDIPMAIETFRHFAGAADRIKGQAVPVPDFMGRPRHCYTRREPVGVVGAITPWNAPTMITSWKLAPALACGCTVVLKPPEDAPLTALHLAALLDEAGLPGGVVNVVPGPGSTTGEALVRHPDVDKLTFTGSPEVGSHIAQIGAAAFKPVTLELGGKSPQLIFADADLDLAIPGAAISLFANAGEVCASGSRVLVHRDVLDDVISGLAEFASGLVVGDPFAPDTNMGALINEKQLNRVLGYIDAGHQEGARLVTGGERLSRAGYFVEPTIFVGRNEHRIAREEIFGPVGTVIPFDTEEEAVELANASRYGLVAVVWTRDISRAHTVAARLKAGAVWVNGWGAPDPRLPWGGMKTSGLGRELGDAAIEAYTEDKAVAVVL